MCNFFAKNNKGYIVAWVIITMCILSSIMLKIVSISMKEYNMNVTFSNRNNRFILADSGIEYGIAFIRKEASLAMVAYLNEKNFREKALEDYMNNIPSINSFILYNLEPMSEHIITLYFSKISQGRIQIESKVVLDNKITVRKAVVKLPSYDSENMEIEQYKIE